MKRLLAFAILNSALSAPALALCGDDHGDDDAREVRRGLRQAEAEERAEEREPDRDTVLVQQAVKGPIYLRLETLAADVVVTAAGEPLISAQVSDGHVPDVRVVQRGEDRFELEFGGHPVLRGGSVIVRVPVGSQLEIATVSGEIAVTGVGGALRVRTASGDTRVDGASDVDARAISGDLQLSAIRGAVRARTVSGDIRVRLAPGVVGKLDVTTVSGDVEWQGACGAGCRIDARSNSGDVGLHLVGASSFDLGWCTHSGDLHDEAHLSTVEHSEGRLRGRLGKGEGGIAVETFAGDLALALAN